jgi:PIN domain nuclease of toxin-antitoxin system
MKKILLDTHTLIWWAEDDERLPASARKIITAAKNHIFISVVSIWEMAIKARLGKLDLRSSPRNYVNAIRADNDFSTIAIEAEHAASVYELPLHHHDPFDRLLIAQAKVEKMIVVSNDDVFNRYDVPTQW